ncbi:Fe-S protein assembly co-chaperone HscB [Telmatospirillum sp. J64-1]|uniref:Fe-S protein assembly co-chaperone HscB n=1 Tax=Telmatospirillum sp. J64-1 TaxID=2502183 RepID=UPI00115F57D3|nr:Fe-S protein assembly co-chaperone HscB [Telmatospirillum sp. J64-1]
MNQTPEVQNPGAEVTPCWSCKGPVAGRALFCSTCGAIQGPGNLDHFTRLGLPRRFAVEQAELDRQYFGFQRRLHPDRFATRSPREKALSQVQATALNEAYNTLKDPLKRAAYLLRLSGRKVDVESAGTIDDPQLLMESMEMREALAEADSVEEVSRHLSEAEANIADSHKDLAAAFAADDLDEAGRLVTRLKYLGKLADEARQRRAKLAAMK